MTVTLLRRLLLCALAGIWVAGARADVVLLGVAILPGDSSDLSGLTGKMSDGTPRDRLGGLGSGIAYTGNGDEYVLVPDRGPKDANEYACRFHRMDIRVNPGASPAVTLKLTATTLLTDEAGRRYVGAHDAFHPKFAEKSLRLDPEAVRVGRDGAIYISDEF